MIKDIYNKVKKLLFRINKGYESFINKKPFYYVTQFFPKNIILFILFIVVLFMSINKIKNNDVLMIATNYTAFRDEIINESIKQDLDTKNINRFEKLGILFGTYKRTNTAKYEYILYKNNKVFDKRIIDSRKIKDSKVKYFKYKTIKVNKSDKYSFEIKPINASKGNAITVVMNEKTDSVYYELRSKSEFSNFIYIAFIITLLLFFIINYLINNNYIKCSTFFLLMLVYLIPTILLVPALQSPDEENHFSRAYSISQYKLSKSPYKNSKKKIYSPSNIKCLYYSMNIKKGFDDNVSDKTKLDNCFKNTNNSFNKSLFDINYSRFFTYFISSIGIKIVDIFTNSPMIIFYSGRVFNFMLSFLIIFYVLKKYDKFNSLILLITMIPMFIYQMCSYSYDSLLNSLCILSAAMLIDLMCGDNKIDKKNKIIYLITTILIFIIKAPYILLPMLVLFINYKKFGNKKYSKWLYVILIIILSLITYKVVNYIPNIGKPTLSNVKITNEMKPSDNLNLIIKDPIQIFRVAKHTFINLGNWYLVTMIGSLGKLRYLFDDNIVYIYLTLLLSYIISHKSLDISIKKRIMSIIMLMALLGGIFLSIYITWTPYGYNYVEGVQGRYFLPLLLPLIVLLLPNKKIINIEDSFYMKAINIIQIYSIVMILVSFY